MLSFFGRYLGTEKAGDFDMIDNLSALLGVCNCTIGGSYLDFSS